jgi:hypothetical protein
MIILHLLSGNIKQLGNDLIDNILVISLGHLIEYPAEVPDIEW